MVSEINTDPNVDAAALVDADSTTSANPAQVEGGGLSALVRQMSGEFLTLLRRTMPFGENGRVPTTDRTPQSVQEDATVKARSEAGQAVDQSGETILSNAYPDLPN